MCEKIYGGEGVRRRKAPSLRQCARAWLFFIPALLVAGCCCMGGRAKKSESLPDLNGAIVHVAPVASSIHRVAIMPFRAPTELIGASMSDLFVTEILRTGRYQLVERGQLSSVLQEAEVALSGITEARAIELGNMLGADGVIIGSVDEYGMMAIKGKSHAVVGLSVRLIDCDSGRVMWSASLANTAKNPTTPVSNHARAVVRGTVVALSKQWKVQRYVSRGDSSTAMPVANAPVGRSTTPPAPPPVVPPPDAPSYSVSDFGLREAVLTWSPAQSPGLSYRVERATDPKGPFVALATIPSSKGSYADKGTAATPLKDATTYYYRMVAVSPAGVESAPGPVRESMTSPPPDPPSAVTAKTPAGRAVQVEWKPSGSEGVVRYVVERSEPPYERFVKAGESTSTLFNEGGTEHSPLQDATRYHYRVRAVNRVGSVGEPGEVVEVTTRPPPAAVQGVQALGGRPRFVEVLWSENEEPDIAFYEVERSADGVSFVSIVKQEVAQGLRYDDRGDRVRQRFRADMVEPLKDGTRYVYRVRAWNRVGSTSDWSEPVEAVTKPAPHAPEGLVSDEIKPRAIGLAWSPNKERDIVAYVVEASSRRDGGYELVARVDAATNYVHQPLGDGLTTYYRIKAVDSDGLESRWSDIAQGRTKPAPNAPENVRVEWVDGMAVAEWDAPPQEDIVKYRLVEQRRIGRGTAWDAEANTYAFRAEDVAKRLVFTVVAVDADGLESAPSAVCEIRAVP